jgi:hypothetical protein
MKKTMAILVFSLGLLIGCKHNPSVKRNDNIKAQVVCNSLGQFAVMIGDRYLGYKSGEAYVMYSYIGTAVNRDFLKTDAGAPKGWEIQFKSYKSADSALRIWQNQNEQKIKYDSIKRVEERTRDSLNNISHEYKPCK